jgi:hypothetical protein
MNQPLTIVLIQCSNVRMFEGSNVSIVLELPHVFPPPMVVDPGIRLPCPRRLLTPPSTVLYQLRLIDPIQ